MVDENTYFGSVLDTISWSESLYCKKIPSFLTSRKFTLFFNELLKLIRYFRTFDQQDSVDLDFYVTKNPNLPLHKPNFEIFIASMVPAIFEFLGTDTAGPDFEITTSK